MAEGAEGMCRSLRSRLALRPWACNLCDFVEVIDIEEGHDAQLRAVVEALPSMPRRNKLLRNRAKWH